MLDGDQGDERGNTMAIRKSHPSTPFLRELGGKKPGPSKTGNVEKRKD